MANARHHSNSRGSQLTLEDRPIHGDSVSRGEILDDNGTATRSSDFYKPRPPSPDEPRARDIEFALGGEYVPKDGAAYGATGFESPKGTY